MDHKTILEALREAHQAAVNEAGQIQQAMSIISGLDGTAETETNHAPRPKHRISAAGRRRIAAAQKARWANVAGRKTKRK